MLWLLLNPQLQEPPPPQPAALVQLQTSGRVQLVRSGEKANVSMQVPVTPQRAWAVLTDYTRTFTAMPDVKAVSMVSRQGQQVRLRQVLKAPYTFGLSITSCPPRFSHLQSSRRSLIEGKAGIFLQN